MKASVPRRRKKTRERTLLLFKSSLRYAPRKASASSQTFRTAIRIAVNQASIFSHGLVNSPIFSVAGEHHQWKDGEAQLDAQDDLAEYQQLGGAALSPVCGDDDGRNDRDERVIRRRSQGLRRILRKPSMTICPASVPVSVEFCPDASRASANSAGRRHTEQRRKEFIGVLDLGDLVFRAVKNRRRHDQDGRIDEQSHRERDRGIDRREPDRLAFAGSLLELRVCTMRGVQVQIVRHHRRAEDADRDIKHPGSRISAPRDEDAPHHAQHAGLAMT